MCCVLFVSQKFAAQIYCFFLTYASKYKKKRPEGRFFYDLTV